jgi:CelD/BcsL family acetyltransferase involved in cellulose biosynthesis
MPVHDVSVATDAAAVHALKSEWTELVLRSARPSIFLTWEWMTTWLARQTDGGTPFVLLIRERPGGALIGLAPLYRPRPAAPLALRALRFMGTGVGADHLAFVSHRDHEETVTRTLADQLLAARFWDLLEFPRLEGTFAAGLTRSIDALGGGHVATALVSADRCPFIPLPRTWEAFAAMLGPHRRSELGRQRRRLEKEGAVAITRIATADDFRDAWGALLGLHQTRRDAVADGHSAFVVEATRAFHEAFARAALARGWLRLYLMRLDGRPIAAEYALSFGGRVTDFQGGFDMTLARFGVGTVLTAYAIQDAIAEAAVEFDFLRGAERYKQERWAAQVREDLSLTAWRRQPRVELTLAARRWGRRLRDAVARRGRPAGEAAAPTS